MMRLKGERLASGHCGAGGRVAISLLLLAFLLAGGAMAAPVFRLKKNYPDIGLAMRTLGGGVPEPLPQPTIHTYTFQSSSGASSRRDLFDPHELWYATQHLGQWRDGNGNLLVLGRPTQLLPEIAEGHNGHVPRAAFDAACASAEASFRQDNPAMLERWLRAFSGATLSPPERLRPGFNLSDSLYYAAEDSATLVYAFRVKTHVLNGSLPSDWYCALVRIGDGSPRDRVRRDFESQFLAAVSALPQTALPSASGGRPAAATPSETASSPTDPVRAAAHRSIANMQGWWHVDTPDYTFLTDVRSATGQRLVRELQSTLPAMRKAYRLLVPPFGDQAEVNIVRIFEDPVAYKRFVGEAVEWSVGCWMPMRRELVILSQGKDRGKTLEIIHHEGFHQYLFYASARIENAVWYNEGHACFFECAQVGANGSVEIPEGARLGYLLANLEKVAANLPAILTAEYDAFYAGTDDRRELNYTTAWALVYFLHKGAPLLRQNPYATILSDYRSKLSASQDAALATASAFEGIDMKLLQRDFVACWKNARQAARRHNPLVQTR